MTPKQEVESLMNQEVGIAKEMLIKYGEFYPYGAYIDIKSKIVDVGAEIPGKDCPNSKDLLRTLQENFKELARRRQCRATAIIFDCEVSLPGTQEKSDAIQICLDHSSNYSAIVFIPYKLAAGSLQLGTTFAQEGAYEIFGHSPKSDR